MNVNCLKRFVPPVVADFYRYIRDARSSRRHIWKGIYQHYRDVPTTGLGYNSERLAEDTFTYTKHVLALAERYRTIPIEAVGEHALLPLVVALIRKNSVPVRILDFGGGMGIAYIHLRSSVVGDGDAVDYHIVENAVVCKLGARLFGGERCIHFHSALTPELSGLDIVYMSSAIQYIEDYAGLLKRLCAYQPQYFLFVKLSAGDIPTYATAQMNLPGTTVPYWFVSVNEIIQILSAEGYILAFKSALEREYNQDNFPPSHRLGRACNLLFVRA